MKKEIVILFLLTLGLTTMNAQSTLRAKRSNIYLSHLIANDSLFLQKLDSIIFNFNCTEIENKNNLRVFNVYSKKNKQKENSYRLSIQLDNQLHLLNKNEVKGYFGLNGYTFFWFYNIPPKLFSLSNKNKSFTYSDLIVPTSHVQFEFDYTEGILTLTEIIGCY